MKPRIILKLENFDPKTTFVLIGKEYNFGIVDFDSYSNVQVGSLPFYLYKDFEGLIPKGTPMFQIIPIKREDWTAVKNEYDQKSWDEKISVFSDLKSGVYKKMFWQKKSFE